jgi:hypothetical protein
MVKFEEQALIEKLVALAAGSWRLTELFPLFSPQRSAMTA